MAGSFDRMRLAPFANCLAIAVAVSLPWSTSVTGILIVAWLLALIPTLSWLDLRRELTTATGGLPVLLVLFGLLGMLWADVTLFERWDGFESFLKLLVIPLLFVQFRRSDGGTRVFAGYLWSCIVLMVASTIVLAAPQLSASLMHYDYVLVKNAATQSGEFATCMFGLLFLGIHAFERRQWWLVLGMLAVALGMLANILFVATGRTALVVILMLLIIFAARQLRVRGVAILFTTTIAVVIVGWLASPYLRERISEVAAIQKYKTTDKVSSEGERIEFYKKSLAFVRAAPIVGYGTGSMTSLFRASAIGQTGSAATATTNPHNQTFAVAIQLGLLGVGLLWAMWIAHLWLFRGPGLAEWVGLVIVVQNVVGSLFNSHLFDFTQGWVYVFGVGVAGGMALQKREPRP